MKTKYQIPLFKLNFDEQEENAIVETLKSKWISMGPKCQEFESLFQEYFNVNHAVSLSNCTDALHLALKVLEVGEGDEVICPSLTFAASVNCIKYVGAKPVFCDIESLDDLNISPSKIRSQITAKTKAIIVVHLAGFPCDMDSIMDIAKEFNLKVIEDACHSPLSEYNGIKTGTIGDVGCFSFFSNKNISTGEGGMLITQSEELATKVKLLRSHGMTSMSYQRASGHSTSYDVVTLGYNNRLDDIRATLGIVQLKKLKEDLLKRKKVRSIYIENLKDLPSIKIPFKNHLQYTSNYIMPIVLLNSSKEKRDLVRNQLQEKGIQTSVHYPAVHLFSIYYDKSVSLPITEYVTDNEITLPMYGDLSEKEIVYICDCLKAIL